MEGIRKGYHLGMEGIRKGYLFCQKWYIKGQGVGRRGGASPYYIFLVPRPGESALKENALHK